MQRADDAIWRRGVRIVLSFIFQERRAALRLAMTSLPRQDGLEAGRKFRELGLDAEGRGLFLEVGEWVLQN